MKTPDSGIQRLVNNFLFVYTKANLATSIGLVFGAENALQRYEQEKRSHDNLIRSRAMRELGRRGIVASETEIEKWQEELIQRELETRKQSTSIPASQSDSQP